MAIFIKVPAIVIPISPIIANTVFSTSLIAYLLSESFLSFSRHSWIFLSRSYSSNFFCVSSIHYRVNPTGSQKSNELGIKIDKNISVQNTKEINSFVILIISRFLFVKLFLCIKKSENIGTYNPIFYNKSFKFFELLIVHCLIILCQKQNLFC